jgi:hypothetical protein
MLAKRNFLISTLLSTIVLSVSITAQEVNCPDGNCRIDVSKLSSSKSMRKKIKLFNSVQKKHILIASQSDNQLKVKYQNRILETFRFPSDKYVQQSNEVLEPLTTEELNTIVFAPNKYVGTEEEIELYLEQQRALGIDLEEIQLTLPMSLCYCKNDREPIYNEKIKRFQCPKSSQHS